MTLRLEYKMLGESFQLQTLSLNFPHFPSAKCFWLLSIQNVPSTQMQFTVKINNNNLIMLCIEHCNAMQNKKKNKLIKLK